MARKQNHISQMDGSYIKLVDWFRPQIPAFRETEAIDQDIADRASRELGFVVTKNNIQGLRKALHLEFNNFQIAGRLAKTKNEELPGVEDARDWLQSLDAQCGELQRQINVLDARPAVGMDVACRERVNAINSEIAHVEDLVRHLYRRLGEDIPETLAAVRADKILMLPPKKGSVQK